jgi:hypothetical protein
MARDSSSKRFCDEAVDAGTDGAAGAGMGDGEGAGDDAGAGGGAGMGDGGRWPACALLLKRFYHETAAQVVGGHHSGSTRGSK